MGQAWEAAADDLRHLAAIAAAYSNTTAGMFGCRLICPDVLIQVPQDFIEFVDTSSTK
jgi:hypothetical protein